MYIQGDFASHLWGNAAEIHPNEENSVYGTELSNILKICSWRKNTWLSQKKG
jgi:hypothetical protein